MPCSPDEARAQVLELASGLGFARTGIAEVRDYPEFARVREWIHRGYAGEMGYLERRLEERTDPAQVLEGARSVIVGAICYDTGEPGSQQPRGGQTACVACGEGTAAPFPGLTSCNECAVGWVAERGSSSCTRCEDGTEVSP